MRTIDDIEYFEPKDFAKKFGMTSAGVVQILKKHGLGKLFFGRWIVSKEEAAKLREIGHGKK